MSDDELNERLKHAIEKGDANEFDAIITTMYEQWWPKLVTFAYWRLLDHAEAENCVNSAWLKAYKSIREGNFWGAVAPPQDEPKTGGGEANKTPLAHGASTTQIDEPKTHEVDASEGTLGQESEIELKGEQGTGGWDPAKGRFRTWLYTILVRVTIDAQRKRGRFPLVDAPQGNDGWLPKDEVSDPTDDEVRRGNISMMRLALVLLDVKFRDPIYFQWFEEMSEKEIAQVLGLPLATLHGRLNTAKRRLRESVITFQMLEKVFWERQVKCLSPLGEIYVTDWDLFFRGRWTVDKISKQINKETSEVMSMLREAFKKLRENL